MDAKQLGLRLLELRLERKLSREQIASMASTSAKYVQHLELGYKMPAFDLALRLATALGVGIAELTKPAKTIYELQAGPPRIDKETGAKIQQEPKKKAAPSRKRPPR